MSEVPSPIELNTQGYPLLPLRDVVIFPHMVLPLFVGRDKSILALTAAAEQDKKIILVTQKNANMDDPSSQDIYEVGTVSNILQLLKLPDGTVKVLVEGLHRARIQKFNRLDPYLVVNIEKIDDKDALTEKEIEILIRSILSQFEQYSKLNNKIPPEIITSLMGLNEPVKVIDTIVAHMPLKIYEKQIILEMPSLKKRVEHLMNLIESEIELLQMEKSIRHRVKENMEKNHREYFLKEQLDVIQKELGQMSENGGNDLDSLAKQIKKSGMSKEVQQKANAELKKLRMMSPMSAEATMSRNYLDWMLALPWKRKSSINVKLDKAEHILDEDHYGLEKVKERIIEYLAVTKRMKKIRGPVLCLVGPPGVGKTSLGQSIARATQRQFVRISLGGVRDEAEIRGHRKTYIGAMPGKIIQKLAKTKVRNPLLLLDEVDKMVMDFRSDPASALLEVLDSEQNSTFSDHYLEVDFDLSDIIFIATANSIDIPPALLDRMEVIRIAGYTEDEKINIALKHLIPKQVKLNGLKKNELTISHSAIVHIIRYYTCEAGVRNLEREISKLCRKTVKKILENTNLKQILINISDIEIYLGVKRHRFGQVEEESRVGQVTGLAWTESGGDLLTIEVALLPGKGKIIRTGKLGEVMQESIQAAITVVRSRADRYKIHREYFEKHDIHVHIPEGATPKDGPSAGIGMCTALVSAVTNNPVRCNIAMTGEITLRGEVLPIGGLKEKLLAARRGGVKKVIIPQYNMRDLKEISNSIYQGLEIHPVRWIKQVFDIALISQSNDFMSIQ